MRFIPVAIASVLFAATRLPAATLTLPLSAFGQAASPDGSTFTVQPSGDPLNTLYNSHTDQEQRAVLEFSLASLPMNASIELAELNFNVTATGSRIVQGQPAFPSIRFYGYAGNNAIADADGDHTADELAREFIDQTGPWTITLDAPLVQSYVSNHASAIGIMTYDGFGDVLVSIQTGASAPTITLTYSLPDLAGDANRDGRIDPDDFALTDRGFANHLTGWSNGDFNADDVVDQQDYFLLDSAYLAGHAPDGLIAQRESQFGSEYVAQLLAAVPEPSSIVLVAVALPLCRRRRGTITIR